MKPLKFLITAGPTREPLDPVRFISNPSTGKMGFALAQAATEAGHTVCLIAGPTPLQPPPVQELKPITTAEQMKNAVLKKLQNTHALIMAAAVADYRPKSFSKSKIKKTEDTQTLTLIRTPDILVAASSNKGSRVHIGFAIETENTIENAQAKLNSKKLDLIVANQLDAQNAPFGTDTNRATLLWRNGRIEALPTMTKHELAQHIIQAVVNSYGR